MRITLPVSEIAPATNQENALFYTCSNLLDFSVGCLAVYVIVQQLSFHRCGRLSYVFVVFPENLENRRFYGLLPAPFIGNWRDMLS